MRQFPSNVICHLRSQFARYGISLMSLSATMPHSTQVQHSKISVEVMVLCTRLQVRTILSQMLKVKEPCKPLRSPQEGTRSLQGFTELQKHSLGWDRPVSPAQILMGRRLKTGNPGNQAAPSEYKGTTNTVIKSCRI